MFGSLIRRPILRSACRLGSAAIFVAFFFQGAIAQENDPGAAPYKSKCLVCHAADGSGNTPVGKSLKSADLRSPDVQKKSDAELADFISTGKGNMPAFKSSTSDEEIHALVTHVRTFGAKKTKKPEGKGQ